MGQHLSQVIALDRAVWESMRDAAFQVILLTRRGSGFWKLPAHEEELKETHHSEGSVEDKRRKEQGFGYETETVTFYALMALREMTATRLSELVNESLSAFASHRDDNGGYGTPGSSNTGAKINALPRHTASATAAHLLFSRRRTDPNYAKAFEPSVNWLVRLRFPSGGWPGKWGDLDPGYLTTAAAILALSVYAKRSDAPPPLASEARTAVRQGYSALSTNQRSGVWYGDGIKRHELRYSATALEFLQRAETFGDLREIIDEDATPVDSLVAAYCTQMQPGGWPEGIADDMVDPVTTIMGLNVVLGSASRGGLESAALAAAVETVERAWIDDKLALKLRAWDWQCLGLLAAHLAGRLTPEREVELQRACNQVLAASRSGTLKAGVVSVLEEPARGPVDYALSEGKGLPRSSVGLWWRARLEEFANAAVVDYLLRAIGWALALLVGLLLGRA